MYFPDFPDFDPSKKREKRQFSSRETSVEHSRNTPHRFPGGAPNSREIPRSPPRSPPPEIPRIHPRRFPGYTTESPWIIPGDSPEHPLNPTRAYEAPLKPTRAYEGCSPETPGINRRDTSRSLPGCSTESPGSFRDCPPCTGTVVCIQIRGLDIRTWRLPGKEKIKNKKNPSRRTGYGIADFPGVSREATGGRRGLPSTWRRGPGRLLRDGRGWIPWRRRRRRPMSPRRGGGTIRRACRRRRYRGLPG